MSKVIVQVARENGVAIFEAYLSVPMILKLVRIIIEVAQELDVRDIPFERSLRAIPGFTEIGVLPFKMEQWVCIGCESHTLLWGSNGEENW
jgi:hypothetical protein